MTTSGQHQSAAASASERVAREDLVLFINACFASTGQSEFYGDSTGQGVSIRFLHDYILGNYRRLYARTLAAGVNHFNQALIVRNLLAAGAPADAAQRAEEGQLILASLVSLPPQRAYHLFRELRAARINNRRSRAVLRAFLKRRPDLAFDAVKYRAHLRAAAAHAHLPLPGELGSFLFSDGKKQKIFTTPLFESFRQAHYSQEALFELPYTIAAGLAHRHKIPQEDFLRRIAPRMTAAERLRLLGAASREGVQEVTFDLGRAPLTKLCLYVLSLSFEERRTREAELAAGLHGAAERALRRTPTRLGRVAAVLDRSFSTSGSQEKRRRPLAVALGVHALLRRTASEFRAFYTTPLPVEQEGADPILITPFGQTGLAAPLLNALDWNPDLVVIVSDGYENDPPGAANEVVRLFRAHVKGGRRVSFVHANPVFDSDRYMPRTLGEALPTIGLRDAEDLLTMLGFARFADGTAPLAELEAYLAMRLPRLLRRVQGAVASTMPIPADSIAIAEGEGEV